jgi:uncharacterized membrane protein
MAERYPRLDALRGLAIVWMVGFHFCFDLNYFGFTRQNFYTDPFWTWQRTCIVSLFLFCAGLGQAIAFSQGQGWPRFWRRWGQVAACAVLVSLGSYLVFPQSFISFGILHGMAVMLLLLRLLGRRGMPWWLLCLLGLLALLLPQWIADPFFDTRLSNWVGLVTHKPVTEDWVPVLPWLGVMLWAFAAGQWLLARRAAWLQAGLSGSLRGLAWLGRWPLSIYMLHQPLLMALLWALKALLY